MGIVDGRVGTAESPSARSERCPICGSDEVVELGSTDGHRMGRCSRCRHLYCLVLPDEETLNGRYASYSYESQSLDTVPEFVFRSLAQVMETFSPFRQKNRLLDVGFGVGTVLRAAASAGWQVHGIEKSSLAVKKARLSGFSSVQEGDFLTADYPREHFDVMTLMDVIEHLPDPVRFLVRSWELLRPGGLLYLSTPNAGSVSARVLGLDWTVVSPPEHLHLFTPSSIRRALFTGGFGDVVIRTEGLNPFELILAAKRHRLRAPSLGARKESAGGPDAAPGGPLNSGFSRVDSAYALNRALMSSAPGRLAKRAANGVLNALRLGDQLKVWAIKRPA
jgi:SAM-dependent methyltransferase